MFESGAGVSVITLGIFGFLPKIYWYEENPFHICKLFFPFIVHARVIFKNISG